MTNNKLLPRLSNCWVMYCSKPRPTDNKAITAITPMMMPSMVRMERILLAVRARKAMRTLSQICIYST
jgi:hypothetical protein